MAFCKNCGASIDDKAAICPSCGVPQETTPAVVDNGGFGWGLLGCCIPIVGLILFLVWKDTKPKTSKAAGTGALVSVIIGIVYYILMIMIGALNSKNDSNEDYFLAGRGLGSWTAALSAQASDMSGWMLMGLPGAIYLAGTGEIWIAVGLLIGTALNWMFVARRLRKYTIVANNSLTIPSFFENRFHDKSGALKVVSSLIIIRLVRSFIFS